MPDNRNKQPIFVSGAGGYVGGRLVPRLLDAGYRVRSLARPLTEGSENPVICHDNRIAALLPQDLFDCRTELRQVASFLPRGLLGLAYWYGVTPFHNFVFDGMLRGIAKAARTPISSGPERFQEQDQES